MKRTKLKHIDPVQRAIAVEKLHTHNVIRSTLDHELYRIIHQHGSGLTYKELLYAKKCLAAHQDLGHKLSKLRMHLFEPFRVGRLRLR